MNQAEFELDEDFYKMSREELLEDIKFRIQADREMLILNWKEKSELIQQNKMLQKALEDCLFKIEDANSDMEKYTKLMTGTAETIKMWRSTCYLLASILVAVMLLTLIK